MAAKEQSDKNSCEKSKENLCQNETETEDLIAELCIHAPSDSVKFCLRNYEYGKSLQALHSRFEKVKRDALCETARYLKLPNVEKTNKALAHLIVCRIQNLLPDNCSLCTERYRVSNSEPAFLDCAICGQGVHKQCWLNIANIALSPEEVPTKSTAKEFERLWNPLRLPGIFYICSACQPTTIPSEDEGNYKAKGRTRSTPKEDGPSAPNKNSGVRTRSKDNKISNKPNNSKEDEETLKNQECGEQPKEVCTGQDTTNILAKETAGEEDIRYQMEHLPSAQPSQVNIEKDTPSTTDNGGAVDDEDIRYQMESLPSAQPLGTQPVGDANHVSNESSQVHILLDPQSQVCSTAASVQSGSSNVPGDKPSKSVAWAVQPQSFINLTATSSQENSEDRPSKSSTVCHHFKEGNCKHGMKGKDCNFTHPKTCNKYMQHGTRQPRGCNKGKSCNLFHPKMCMDSLRKGECFSETCELKHVKGTKRHPPVKKINVKQNQEQGYKGKTETSKSTGSPSNESGHFLEMLSLLKQEILEKLNQNMSLIQSQIQQIQSQQAQSLPTPPVMYQATRPQAPMFPPYFQPMYQ